MPPTSINCCGCCGPNQEATKTQIPAFQTYKRTSYKLEEITKPPLKINSNKTQNIALQT
jgi:hypothetical protein